MSLKHSLLALLSLKSTTGYQLSKEVEGSINFFWKATHQQIYRDLTSLEQSAWVKHVQIAQDEKPDKKVYSITKLGTKELLRWMKEPSELPAHRDSFMIKLFLGNLIGASPLMEDISRQKKIYVDRQNQYREIEKKYHQDFPSLSEEQQYRYMTLRRGILMGQAWLAWCEEVEGFLKTKESK